MKITAENLAQTEELASRFVNKLVEGGLGEVAVVVALHGDLGAGKTAFVKGVAEALGIKKEFVTSPTFVIQKIYDLSNTTFHKLIHIDAYRFESAKEADILKLDLLLQDPRNLIFIEWPDRMESHIPKNAKRISFAFIDDNRRKITFHESR
jgi:tRNA threonylcarbamoyladenosine biosynthesis protein TsaE